MSYTSTNWKSARHPTFWPSRLFSPALRPPAPQRGLRARWNASPARSPSDLWRTVYFVEGENGVEPGLEPQPFTSKANVAAAALEKQPAKTECRDFWNSIRDCVRANAFQSVARANSSSTARRIRAFLPTPPRLLRRLLGRRLSSRSLQALPTRRWKIYAGSNTEPFRSPRRATIWLAWCEKLT